MILLVRLLQTEVPCNLTFYQYHNSQNKLLLCWCNIYTVYIFFVLGHANLGCHLCRIKNQVYFLTKQIYGVFLFFVPVNQPHWRNPQFLAERQSSLNQRYTSKLMSKLTLIAENAFCTLKKKRMRKPPGI